MKKRILLFIILSLIIGVVQISTLDVNGESNSSVEIDLGEKTSELKERISSLMDKGPDYFKGVISNFSDMGKHWADVTVGKLVELGVIAGYDDGTFKPDDTISRAEFVKITRTALKLDLVEGNSFKDTTNHWAKNDVHTLVTKGGIDKSEYGSNFEPNKDITRIEMAKMIVRSIGLTEKAKELAGVKTQFVDDNSIPRADKGYIIIASKNEIINGYPDKTFKPNGKATRAEASQMMLNALEKISEGISVEEEQKEVVDEWIDPEFYTGGEEVSSVLFEIYVKNHEEIKKQGGYKFKVECLNYPEVNYGEFILNGSLIKLDRDRWRELDTVGNNGFMYSVGILNYSSLENMENFKVKKGTVFKYKITLKKGDKEKEYFLDVKATKDSE